MKSERVSIVVAKHKKNILIISHDKIGKSMAGPGIRYHFMGKELSKNFNVRLGFFDQTYVPEANFESAYSVTYIDKERFQDIFEKVDVVIAMWLSDEMIDYCNANGIFIVFDVYAPVPVENLALFMYGANPVNTDTDYTYVQSFSMYKKFFSTGDLFLFSNRRQLDFWAGYVFGSGQINVSGYTNRPFFDRFIYAPMGVDTNTSIEHGKNVLRNVIDGIGADDQLLIWTGGIWNWFDAKVLIKAMKLIEISHPEIKLVFFGTKHPNPNVPAMKEAADAFKIAEETGLLNKTVFLKDGWVDYNDRINYLVEANAAVNTAKSTIESEFSHRTRVLDHFLACLPTIATEGDYLTDDVIVPNNLGISVPAGDEKALSNAIVNIVEPKNNRIIAENVKNMRPMFDWSNTLNDLNKVLMGDIKKLKLNQPNKDIKTPPTGRVFKAVKKFTPKPIKKLGVRIIGYGR